MKDWQHLIIIMFLSGIAGAIAYDLTHNVYSGIPVGIVIGVVYAHATRQRR